MTWVTWKEWNVMPIFTFVCDGCGYELERVCSVAERDAPTGMCPNPECPKTGDVLRWKGIEGATVVNADGSYRFALIRNSGERVVSPKAEARKRR